MNKILIENKRRYTHNLNDYAFYIGRGSVLGNPFTHIPKEFTKAEFQVRTREESINSYRIWIKEKIEQKDYQILSFLKELAQTYLEHDIHLVCYCAPKSCHGEVIKEIVESMVNDVLI